MPQLIQTSSKLFGNNASYIVKVAGREGLSMPFRYNVDIVTTCLDLTPDKVVGKEFDFHFCNIADKNADPYCYFHGIVSSFISIDNHATVQTKNNNSHRAYSLVLEPMTCLMQKSTHSRVFHKKSQTVADVIEFLLNFHKIPFDNKIKNPLKWEYCTQYNETDFQFFSRILSEAGIYYYFLHEKDKPHKMVLADDEYAYLDAVTAKSVQETNRDQSIQSVQSRYQIYSKSVAAGNAKLENDTDCLFTTDDTKAPFNIDTNSSCEQFHYATPTDANNDKAFVTPALDRESRYAFTTEVRSNIIPLHCANKIKFDGKTFEEMQDKEHVITMLQFEAADNTALLHESRQYYANWWTSMPAKICFRPARQEKPHPGQIQLAVVSDAEGKLTGSQQPVHCDKYGRHSVKFLWEEQDDKKNKTHQHDTPHVRVLNQWDNGNYRVGTPVVVAFIDGDIDKPMIIGACNDTKNLLLGNFSASNQESSIIKRYPGADNSKGNNYNSITFKDKDGEEQFDVFAGKDMGTIVNKGNRTTTIKEGDDTYTLEKGKRSLTIAGDETRHNKAKLSHTVDGDYEMNVKGKFTLNVSGEVVIVGSKVKLNP